MSALEIVDFIRKHDGISRNCLQDDICPILRDKVKTLQDAVRRLSKPAGHVEIN